MYEAMQKFCNEYEATGIVKSSKDSKFTFGRELIFTAQFTEDWYEEFIIKHFTTKVVL